MGEILRKKRLSKRRMQAIVALLKCRTVRQAADTVGVGESTLFRWLQDPAFKDAYHEAKFEVVQQALSQLQKASGKAVQVLQSIMKDAKVSPHTRVTAARVILETSIKAIEIDTLEARIEKLEAFIEEQMEG